MPKYAADAGDRCLRIIKSVGSRAKNLIYLSEYFNLLPVCVICKDSMGCLVFIVMPSIWVVSRYFKADATMASIDTEFETVWGWKACEISEIWRRSNEAQKLKAGWSQKKTTARGSSISRHLSEAYALEPSATESSIVPFDDLEDLPQMAFSMTSSFPEVSDSQTLPSLNAH